MNAGAVLRVRVQQDSHLVIIIRLGRLISHPYTAARIHMLQQRAKRGGGRGGLRCCRSTWNGTSFMDAAEGQKLFKRVKIRVGGP